MELFAAITERRTHRKEFRQDPISQADLDQLIEAARWAPSPFNTQPWEFLIIREAAGKNVIAEVTAQRIVEQFKDARFLDDNSRWMRVTETAWDERGDGVLLTDHIDLPPVFRKDPNKLKPLLKNAKHLSILGHLGGGKMPAKEIADLVRTSPLLILVLMDTTRRPPGEGGRRWMWLGMGGAIQNLLLAATGLQIGTQFVSAPLECHADREKIRKIFSIPDSREIITLLRLGYVDSTSGKSVRLRPSTFVQYENYTESGSNPANDA
jgi:nitroreductase